MPEELKDNSYFHADKHVSIEADDAFGRYPFAKKLAELIASHYDSQGLVIGIYGQWGEGKSSFMDFIQAATNILSIQNPDLHKTIIVKFNPWRFSDEDQLLMSFFAELRAALGAETAIDTTTLDSNLLKYTRVLLARKSVFGELTAEQLDKFQDLGSLEVLKEDINRALHATGRKLLVLIDDSDRLSNEEVSTTLRLVKLTADFTNTTYIIGLNHEMVADAIGKQYPSGDRKAGMQFLEKIIQVPLYLPPIQDTKMRRYVQQRIDDVLFRTGLFTQQSEADKLRYNDAMQRSILPFIPNPRAVYRLANTLLVALPLLEDEANVTDIILIEALKVLFPDVYDLVRKNKDVLAVTIDGEDNETEGTYEEPNFGALGEEENIKKVFGNDAEKAGEAYVLLANLFPIFYSAYKDNLFSSYFRQIRKRPQKELDRAKSIASRYYFERYFFYTVLEGEIPERTFEQFLQTMRIDDGIDPCKQAEEMIKLSNDDVFFKRLEDRIAKHREANLKKQVILEEGEQITPAEAERYCDLLICLSSKLTNDVLGDRSARLLSRSSGLLLAYIKLLPEQQVVEVTKRIITQSGNFQLPLELILDIRRIRRWQKENEDEFKEIELLFTLERFKELCRTLINRVKEIAAAANAPWYVYFGHTTVVLIDIWQIAYGKDDLTYWLTESFQEDAENLATFFKYAFPTANTGNSTVGIRLDIEHYDYLRELIDVDTLYIMSKALVRNETIPKLSRDLYKSPTDHERVHQFI